MFRHRARCGWACARWGATTQRTCVITQSASTTSAMDGHPNRPRYIATFGRKGEKLIAQISCHCSLTLASHCTRSTQPFQLPSAPDVMRLSYFSPLLPNALRTRKRAFVGTSQPRPPLSLLVSRIAIVALSVPFETNCAPSPTRAFTRLRRSASSHSCHGLLCFGFNQSRVL